MLVLLVTYFDHGKALTLEIDKLIPEVVSKSINLSTTWRKLEQ